MSMSNLIVQASTAHLITDSGHWDKDGNLLVLGRKTIIFREHFMAFSTVGSMTVQHIDQHIHSYSHKTTQEELIADIVQATKKAYIEEGKSPVEKRSVGMIAGYSHAVNRAFGGHFCTSPKDAAEGEAPWEVYNTNLMTSPFVAPYNELMHMTGKDFDLHFDTLPLIKKQREYDGFDGIEGCGVAGKVEAVSIDRNGVRIETLHEYPDVVGMPAGLIPTNEGGIQHGKQPGI